MSFNSVQSFVIENCNGPTIENGLNNVCLHPLSRTFAFYLWGETIRCAAISKKKKLAMQKILSKKILINEILLKHVEASEQINILNNISKAQSALDDFIDMRTEGAIVRSRARWTELREKNTKYFRTLKSKHAATKAINRLVGEEDIVLTDPKQILIKARDFYQALYGKRFRTKREFEIVDELNALNIPQLDARNAQKIDEESNEQECYNIHKKMTKSKSPGLDGLAVNFCLIFWPLITNLFSEELEFSWQTGNLIPTQQQGVITLLLKPNKNHQDISHYRPITLLNVDYKIISKVISHRMRKYLPILIHPDQNDFLKGRSLAVMLDYSLI